MDFAIIYGLENWPWPEPVAMLELEPKSFDVEFCSLLMKSKCFSSHQMLPKDLWRNKLVSLCSLPPLCRGLAHLKGRTMQT